MSQTSSWTGGNAIYNILSGEESFVNPTWYLSEKQERFRRRIRKWGPSVWKNMVWVWCVFGGWVKSFAGNWINLELFKASNQSESKCLAAGCHKYFNYTPYFTDSSFLLLASFDCRWMFFKQRPNNQNLVLRLIYWERVLHCSEIKSEMVWVVLITYADLLTYKFCPCSCLSCFQSLGLPTELLLLHSTAALSPVFLLG